MSYGMLSSAGRTCAQDGKMNFTRVNKSYRDACHVHVHPVCHNRDSDFHTFMCSLFPRTIFIGF